MELATLIVLLVECGVKLSFVLEKRDLALGGGFKKAYQGCCRGRFFSKHFQADKAIFFWSVY